MSELNWYWVYVPYLDSPNRQQDSAIRAGYNKVVFKSEADKVIAGLQEKLNEQTSIAEERFKEFRTYHTSYAEAVKELYDKNKEIAELKEKHKTDVKELLCLIRDKDNNFNRAFDSEEKEIRHQKYKRCLAMAKLCHWKMGVFIYKKEKSDFYYRWHKRWLELAKNFKEVNNG